jgi:4-hydroxy-tetrahydrodipicolinate synthase
MSDPLRGIFPAIWTPTRESGALDRAALQSNISFLRRSGVHGLMALGSTAEFARFSGEERKAILQAIVSEANGLPVLVNVSDIRLENAIALGLGAKSVGAFAISALPPYFFPVEQDDLVEYFVRLAEAVQLPLVLYNFPEVTGKRIEIETIAAVGRRVELLGVKQSGNDFEYHKQLLQLAKSQKFAVMTGFDTRLLDALSWGAAGCVSGLANAVADHLVALYQAYGAGDPAAPTLAGQMAEMGGVVARLSFPLNVMAAIEARGLRAGAFKTPIAPRTRARYTALVEELKAFYARMGLAVPPVT